MPKIAVVMPCYKSARQAPEVLTRMPEMVEAIYCVDDACPEKTGEVIKESCKDERLRVLFHDKNQGVGGAMITGYRQALEEGMEIIIKLDSDGQMDPALIPVFVAPIIDGIADYTKGNRFFAPEFLPGMPKIRIFGNACLSFMSKLSSGYWQVFDPTNGYTAIHAEVLKLLPLDKLDKGYFFESDMLFRLSTLRAVVLDIPQKAIYGDEKSNLKITEILWPFFGKHMKNFFKRLVYSYFVRDFHVASLEWVFGPILLLFSFFFGVSSWIENVHNQTEASAGTVMLAALPFLAGLQLTLSALNFDVQNQPRIALHRLSAGEETDL